MVDFSQIFVAFSIYLQFNLHLICNLFVQKEIEIFERMEFILWWKTLWYSLLTIVECSTNFLERKNAPARQWQSVINPAGQQLRCDAQRADVWNFVQGNWLSIPQLWSMIKVFFITAFQRYDAMHSWADIWNFVQKPSQNLST